MKKPSAELFELVKSLSKSEKRYIRLQCTQQDKVYEQLFDLLLNQKSYDEVQLKQENGQLSFMKYLPVAKRNLTDFILNALDRYRKKDKEDRVFKRLHFAKILWRRGLKKQARKYLTKARQEALRHELYLSLLQASALNKQFMETDLKEKKIRKIYENEKEWLRKQDNINEYWWLNTQISLLQLEYQKLQEKGLKDRLETLFQHPLLQEASGAITFQSQLYYLQAKATYYFTTGNSKEAYRCNERFLQLIEQNAYYLDQFPERYLTIFNNYLIDSLLLKKYDALDKGLQKLATLPEAPQFNHLKNLDARIFRQRYLLQINWYLSTKQIKKGVALIPTLEKGIITHKKTLQMPHRITLQYLAAYLLFLNRQYQQSLTWINALLDERETVLREIFQFTRLLNLLNHFELGNFEYLESLLPSTRRFLRNKRTLYATELALFRYLNGIMNAVSDKQKRDLTAAFLEELKQLKANPKEQQLFNYIDLIYWLEKKN